MRNNKNILIILFISISSLVFGQKIKVPADFKLEYKYDAGMVQLREDLQLTKDKGSYKAFEKGKDFEVIFVKKNNAEIQRLYEKLYASGFFDLKQKDEGNLVIKEQINDKASKTLLIVSGEKNYFLDEDDIAAMEPAQAAVAKKAFMIVQEFTNKRRK